MKETSELGETVCRVTCRGFVAIYNVAIGVVNHEVGNILSYTYYLRILTLHLVKIHKETFDVVQFNR